MRLKLHKSENRVHEINKAAAELACQAAAAYADESGVRAVVAGSMGPTGELFVPMGELTFEQALPVLRIKQSRWQREVHKSFGSRRCRRTKRLPLPLRLPNQQVSRWWDV
jgi:hypothetical protein